MRLIITLLSFFFYQLTLFAEPDWSAVVKTLSQLPDWEASARFEPVGGGWTNQNYKLILPDSTYFVRIGSTSSTILGLDADREFACASFASAMGIAPPILYYDQALHLTVNPFLSSRPFEWSEQNVQKVVEGLKIFHQSKCLLPIRFCPFAAIDDYLAKALRLREGSLPLDWEEFAPIIAQLRKETPLPSQLSPCHLDLHHLNFLDEGEKIWLLDWEYSGMCDPIYDLATWVSADSLSEEQMRLLLKLYDPASDEAAFERLEMMAFLVDLRWGLWCLIQDKVSPLEQDYMTYGEMFFSQARARLSKLMQEVNE